MCSLCSDSAHADNVYMFPTVLNGEFQDSAWSTAAQTWNANSAQDVIRVDYLSDVSSTESSQASNSLGGGPRVVVSTAAFHARVRGSVPGLGGLKETKLFLPHPRVKVSIVGSLRDREVACSASDRQGSNFESCVWRTVSSQSSHHPQEVLLAQFSLYVHKGGLKPDSFYLSNSFLSLPENTSYSDETLEDCFQEIKLKRLEHPQNFLIAHLNINSITQKFY